MAVDDKSNWNESFCNSAHDNPVHVWFIFSIHRELELTLDVSTIT